MRVDVEEDLMDDMGGTPTPMNAANRAQQAYAAAGRDKRKRKVRSSWQKIPSCLLGDMFELGVSTVSLCQLGWT